MSFSLENGHENGLRSHDSIYSGYGVKKAYEDGNIFVYLFDKCCFPLRCLINGKRHVGDVYWVHTR